MTQSHLETARLLQEAFMNRDLDAFLSQLDDEIEWEIGAYLTGRASYRGKDGVREWWREVAELSEADHEELVPTFQRDEELPDGRLLRLGHIRIMRPQGMLKSEFGVIYAFREGRVSSVRNFMSHEEALREAGLEA
jgi:ketosteroid isomerase-like protein